MLKEDAEDLAYRIDAEGFDYTFDGYSDWDEIQDDEFHRLREAYVDAKNELENYITSCGGEFGESDEDFGSEMDDE